MAQNQIIQTIFGTVYGTLHIWDSVAGKSGGPEEENPYLKYPTIFPTFDLGETGQNTVV